jgi:hypothetical protein
LPDLARSIGKALHQVKSMTDDVKQSFEEVTGDEVEEPRKTEEADTSEAAGDDWSENPAPGGEDLDMIETAGTVEDDIVEFPVEENPQDKNATETKGSEIEPPEGPHDPPTTAEPGGQGNLRG